MSELYTGNVVDFFGQDGPLRAREVQSGDYGSRQGLEEPPADAEIRAEWEDEAHHRALGSEALKAA